MRKKHKEKQIKTTSPHTFPLGTFFTSLTTPHKIDSLLLIPVKEPLLSLQSYGVFNILIMTLIRKENGTICSTTEENIGKTILFDLSKIPRTTIAQSMDILSSMSGLSGYKSIIKAAELLPKMFPMMITAAGSIKPVKVVVLGAGVAGLQAIATAKRLGAVVEASDPREAAKEEVLSLGAKFIEVEGAVEDKDAGGYAVKQTKEYLSRQKEEVSKRLKQADVVVTTAQVLGSKSPVLISKAVVDEMRPGSVIIDLASSTGGNCELTKDNKIVIHNGVSIVGNSYLASELAHDASNLFSNNVFNFISHIFKDGKLIGDEDDILKNCKI